MPLQVVFRQGPLPLEPAGPLLLKEFREQLDALPAKARGGKYLLTAFLPTSAEYVRVIVSEMSRNDSFAMVDAGRALSHYDARPWASTTMSLRCPPQCALTSACSLAPWNCCHLSCP